MSSGTSDSGPAAGSSGSMPIGSSDSGAGIREPTVVTTLRSLEEIASRPACLVVIHGDNIGNKFDLLPGAPAIAIGRARTNEICVDHRSVSRRHVELVVDDTGVKLTDLRSTNGTLVNDQRVNGSIYLRDGDRIKVGRTVIKFISGNAVEAALHEHMYTRTRYDPLTGVHNRRSFDDKLEEELARAQRYGRALALMLFDIDHFKRCNDTWGHRAGDHVLREVAQVVRDRVRKHDFVARYGGEEFAVILVEFDQPTPEQFAEGVRAAIAEHDFDFEGNVIRTTISGGVVEWNPGFKTSAQLIEAADQLLYQAKSGGRNRIITRGTSK
jgi:two-component system cell cycle response regulator